LGIWAGDLVEPGHTGTGGARTDDESERV